MNKWPLDVYLYIVLERKMRRRRELYDKCGRDGGIYRDQDAGKTDRDVMVIIIS